MSKTLAIAFYPTPDNVRVAVGRRARIAVQDQDGLVKTRDYSWTWRDRTDPYWRDVPVIDQDQFDAQFGPCANG